MADKLESYFKKHLSDETPGDDNWNVPSDELWNKTLPKINNSRKAFIPKKYIYLLSILLLIAIGLTYWIINDSDLTTTGSNKGTEDSINSVSKKSGISHDTIIEKDTEYLNIVDEKEVTDLSTEELQGNLNITGDYSDNQKNISNEEKLPYENKTTENQRKIESLQNSKYKYGGPLQTKLAIGMASISTLPFTGTLHTNPDNSLLVNNSDTDFAPTLNNKPVKTFVNKNKYGIGIFYSPTYNNTQVIGDVTTGLLETGNVYLYSGNWGFEFRYFLSDRITLLSGIEQSKVKSWSRSEVDFAYNTSTEHIMPDGDKENMSPVPMPTPFGEIDTEITYHLPGEANIPNGETMNSILETHQEIQYYSIPLGMEYNITSKTRTKWFAEGGLRYNHTYLDASRFTSRIVHLGQDMAVTDEKLMNSPSYKSSYFNFYLGTGINYQFSDKFLLSGSIRYFNNLTKVNLQDNASTKVRGYSLKIGILYIF